jgi:hypothetical protein
MTTLRRVAFLSDRSDLECPVTRIRIDGRDFVDMIREVEQPFADADGTPSIAGSYRGLPPRSVLPPSEHFWGEPDGRRTRLYLCGDCHEAGCWDFQAVIRVEPDRVVWGPFFQPHRPRWDHSALGLLVFDRDQYAQALMAAVRALRT